MHNSVHVNTMLLFAECDECVHVLKDDLDEMQVQLDTAVEYMNSVSGSANSRSHCALP